MPQSQWTQAERQRLHGAGTFGQPYNAPKPVPVPTGPAQQVPQAQGAGSGQIQLTAKPDPRMDEVYGAKAVELALRAAAQIIKASVREMDHAARFDDQTFALMLPGAGIVEACSLAERVRVAVQAYPLRIAGSGPPCDPGWQLAADHG